MSFNKSKEAFLEVETYWTEGFNEKEEICQIFTPLSRNHPIFQNVISLLKHNAIKDTLIQIAMVTILCMLSLLCMAHILCMYLETIIAVIVLFIGIMLIVILNTVQVVLSFVILYRKLNLLVENTDISIALSSEYKGELPEEKCHMDHPLCIVKNEPLFFDRLYIVKASWEELVSNIS